MSESLQDLDVSALVGLIEANGGKLPLAVEELERRLEEDPENTGVAAALEKVRGEEAPAARAQSDQTWLVQRLLHDVDLASSSVQPATWADVGTVVVPARTKRKTIVEKALEMYPDAVPGKKAGAPAQFRVLDGDSTATIPVRWEVPPAPEPELVIG